MKMNKLLSMTFAVILLTISGAAQALTLDIRDGALYGAQGVLIGGSFIAGSTPEAGYFSGGVSYDVEFIDGKCTEIFNGCNEASDFTFTTENAAATATQSLLNQVFRYGEFDDYADRTNGISYENVGFLVTPWGVAGSLIEKVFGENYSITGLLAVDRVTRNARHINVNSDSGGGSDWVYVKWTLSEPVVSAVPLPAALPLYGAGLATMGLIGWHRKRKTQQ